jgi:adenosylcobinamide-phosphate synthase
VTALALACACAADALFGDPEGWPHPVRLIGAACSWGERRARIATRGSERRELLAGALLCASIVGGAYCSARGALTLAYRSSRGFGFALEVFLAWTALAARDLLAEADAVSTALERGDIAHARVRVARIVGRDTAQLEAAEIARATIETLAESACDGVVAPLLALAFGGVPLALAFKAANTLDSMIGHIEPPYTAFGRVAARLDDLACYVPARVTAFALAGCAPLAGGDVRKAFAVLRADGHRHRSPNAGRPEAAMAGALGVRLGGGNTYGGIVLESAALGAAYPAPSVAAIRRAAWLVAASTVVLGATICVLLALIERARTQRP